MRAHCVQGCVQGKPLGDEIARLSSLGTLTLIIDIYRSVDFARLLALRYAVILLLIYKLLDLLFISATFSAVCV